MDEDLLEVARAKHQKALEAAVVKQLSGEQRGKKLFVWKERLIKILIDKSEPCSIGDLRKVLRQKWQSEYELLPDDVMDGRINSVISQLVSEGSLRNLRGLKLEFLTHHDARVVRYGLNYEVKVIQEGGRAARQRFLEKMKKEKN